MARIEYGACLRPAAADAVTTVPYDRLTKLTTDGMFTSAGIDLIGARRILRV